VSGGGKSVRRSVQVVTVILIVGYVKGECLIVHGLASPRSPPPPPVAGEVVPTLLVPQEAQCTGVLGYLKDHVGCLKATTSCRGQEVVAVVLKAISVVLKLWKPFTETVEILLRWRNSFLCMILCDPCVVFVRRLCKFCVRSCAKRV